MIPQTTIASIKTLTRRQRENIKSRILAAVTEAARPLADYEIEAILGVPRSNGSRVSELLAEGKLVELYSVKVNPKTKKDVRQVALPGHPDGKPYEGDKFAIRMEKQLVVMQSLLRKHLDLMGVSELAVDAALRDMVNTAIDTYGAISVRARKKSSARGSKRREAA